MYPLVRPLLFSLDAERAHHLGLFALSLFDGAPKLAKAVRRRAKADARPALRTTVAGLDFPNCVGLAAGLDKNAEAIVGLYALGFGFLEVGTVTPRPQPGNPSPRLFRIPAQKALLNRMGFNNAGAYAMAERLREAGWRPGPLGVNLGKNKDTPLEAAPDDYRAGAEALAPHADYLVVNLSSPNTPGLRTLQEPKALEAVLRATLGASLGRPVFLKIAPDLEDEAVDAAVDVALATGAQGLIATNTTLARPFEHPLAKEAGGLSGAPLRSRSTAVIRRAFRRSGGRLPILGVGGVFTADDAWEKLRAGASLVQLYTGFIYGGPTVVRAILDGLDARLAQAGLKNVSQAVGADAG